MDTPYTSLHVSARAEGLLSKLEAALESALDSSSHLPGTLWHYTTTEGLRAILSSHRLRLSHARFLNDSSEIALGWSRVTAALDGAIFSATNLKGLFEMTKSVTGKVYHATHYFTFCLSARADSLSQWRAYSDSGSGYSLGFDPKQLLASTEPDVTCLLLRMVYSRADQSLLLERGVEAAREFFGELLQKPVAAEEKEPILGRANVRLSHFMMRAALSFKDDSFEDEREWRLVTGLHPDEASCQELLSHVDFRSGGGIVRPYLDVPHGPPPDKRLPISRIVLGPTLRPVLTRESLDFFLAQKGYGAVPVDDSNVPLQA